MAHINKNTIIKITEQLLAVHKSIGELDISREDKMELYKSLGDLSEKTLKTIKVDILA